MQYKIVYTDGTEEIMEFGTDEECAEYCHLEDVLYFERLN